jgi:hypothetical protein
VESKWKNYHIITFPGQPLSKTEEMCEMLQLEIKHSRGKLLPHSDLGAGGGVFRGNHAVLIIGRQGRTYTNIG